MYFLANLKKKEKPKVLSKTLEKTQGPQKKPKNPRLLRKTQDIGRKPKQWQRWKQTQRSNRLCLCSLV